MNRILNILYTILLILVLIMIILYQYPKKNDSFSYSKPLISIFILNYERPHNLETLLSTISHYSDPIGEIIVCNTHPMHAIHKISYGEKLGNIPIYIYHDFEYKNRYGAARRWKNALKWCHYPWILFLDDDIVPSFSLINKMYTEAQEDIMTIYGPILRRCDISGYYTNATPENYNVILTPILLVNQSLLIEYMKDGWNQHESFLEKTKGNGEDLSINSFLYHRQKKPIYVEGSYEWLDTRKGYSSRPYHFQQRRQFCQDLFF